LFRVGKEVNANMMSSGTERDRGNVSSMMNLFIIIIINISVLLLL